MRSDTEMKLWWGGPVNSFLLCAVVAKQARRLESLMPDRRMPELITIALKNCADYELALELDPGMPAVVREEAMQIGRRTRRLGVVPGDGEERQAYGWSRFEWRARRDRRYSRRGNIDFWKKRDHYVQFLSAGVSILRILAVINPAFKGNLDE